MKDIDDQKHLYTNFFGALETFVKFQEYYDSATDGDYKAMMMMAIDHTHNFSIEDNYGTLNAGYPNKI